MGFGSFLEEQPVPPTPSVQAAPPFSLEFSIQRAALEYGVDPELIRGIIAAESAFQQDAVSPVGAIGYMQLMPGTAAEMGYDPTDPEQNIQAGSKYISLMIDRYENRRNGLQLAIAAYNAGPGNVDRYRGIPPFRETRTYVKRVMGYYAEYEKFGAPLGPDVLAE